VTALPPPVAAGQPATRSLLRAVAVPTEHGGWGLTAEPGLLGLLVAPSVAGLCIGVAALLAFVARTPLKVLLVDRSRQRHSERAPMARRVLAVESLALVALAAGAVASADGPFWWPLLVAAPLVLVELWFDMRSRGRRLAPELAGSVGISSVVAMVALAGGTDARLAVALWLVLAARAVTSIPYVRAQIARIHRRTVAPAATLRADSGAVALAAVSVMSDPAVAAGAVSVLAIVVLQRVLARGDVPAAKLLGLRQMALGLLVVAVTAAGVHLS
jgi:hypothetical protein